MKLFKYCIVLIMVIGLNSCGKKSILTVNLGKKITTLVILVDGVSKKPIPHKFIGLRKTREYFDFNPNNFGPSWDSEILESGYTNEFGQISFEFRADKDYEYIFNVFENDEWKEVNTNTVRKESLELCNIMYKCDIKKSLSDYKNDNVLVMEVCRYAISNLHINPFELNDTSYATFELYDSCFYQVQNSFFEYSVFSNSTASNGVNLPIELYEGKYYFLMKSNLAKYNNRLFEFEISYNQDNNIELLKNI